MKNIKIIRHAESMANAGFTTLDQVTIPLSKLWKYQAQKLADNRKDPVDLIIHSSYDRTLQTAKPLIAKYPEVKILQNEIIHEFGYLDHELCQNTTSKQRNPRKQKFRKNDIYYKNSLTSESFIDLHCRALDFTNQFHNLPDNTVIFSHQQFIVMLLSILNSPDIIELSNNSKKSLHQELQNNPIQNTQIIELSKYIK